jgi:hypothetical protein
MSFRRTVLLCVTCVLLSFLAVGAFGQTVCTSTNLGAGTSIEMPTVVGGEATYTLDNPIGKTKTATDIKVSWPPEPNASPAANIKPFPFTLGSCGPDPLATTKPLTQYFAPGSDFAELKTAEAIVIRFVPNDSGSFARYLRLTWKESGQEKTQTYKVTGNAGIPDYAKDARYKIWAYTGFTFLRSQNDFSDSFAELLLRVETRWTDARIAMKHNQPDLYEKIINRGTRCNDDPTPDGPITLGSGVPRKCGSASFGIVRLYGEAGLTGTTASSTGATVGTIGGAQESFAGGFGVGFGYTRLVTFLRDEDTSAFSLLFVPRLGIKSVPAQTGKPETAFTAYDYSANIRIENEPRLYSKLDPDDKIKAGNFEGAYFEFGFGESEQFSRKKFPRLRVDGYLPIPSNSDLFRFAMRLQVDAPRPFATAKTDSTVTPPKPRDNLGNEIRISALFNINLLELGKRMAGK